MGNSQYHTTLTGADVDALFRGRYEAAPTQQCDNCGLPIRGDDALTFGGESAFEMPVWATSELARELVILRRRHQRETITLCYACTDALQEPVGGARRTSITTDLRSATRADDGPSRLFAI